MDVETEDPLVAARGREGQAVELDRSAVGRTSGDDDLPLAWQERGEPLLLEGEGSELVEDRFRREVAADVLTVGGARGRVPHRVAARLRAGEADRVVAPPDLGELGELHPVDLDVLPRGDLPEPVGLRVVLPAVAEVADHAGHRLKLLGADPAAGDTRPQHEAVALAVVVDAHQPHPADRERPLAFLDLLPRVGRLALRRLGLHGGAHLAWALFRVEYLPAHALLPPRAACASSASRSRSDFVPRSWTEQWIPHSLSVSRSHHHRPARSGSPGRIARVHGAHPIEVKP